VLAQSNPSSTAIIHLARLGKPVRIFTDGFVEDDGARLRTFTRLPAEIGLRLGRGFSQDGWLRPGQVVASIAKYLFYQKNFSIMEFRDPAEALLGYYCDIVTRLERRPGGYFLTDLILDLWVTPELACHELDRDEFEAARQSGLISPDLALLAQAAIESLKADVTAGTFLSAYVS